MPARLLIVLALVTAACGDDGNNRLPDAPIAPDAPIDAPVDTPPADVEVAITVSGNGGGSITSDPAGIDCGATCSAEFPPGTVLTLTAVPDAGSVFAGWGGVCATSGTTPTCQLSVDDLTSASSLLASVSATFTLQTYTVTVTKSGAGTGTVSGGPITCGATCIATVDHGTVLTLTAAPDALAMFAGWGGACSGTGTCMVTVTDDLSITAAFALDDLTLTVARGGTGTGTVTSNPAGINCGADCDETYTANQMIVLTATPAVGSTFTGWTGGGCSGTGTCTVTMTSALVVTANFTLNTYALTVTRTGMGTVTSDPAGIACGSDCDETYAHGTSVQLMAVPTTGWSFAGWSGACTGTGACTVAMTQARDVTATFTLNTYALTVMRTGMGTVASTPAGISCGADCTETYPHGTNVMLTATPQTGWSFTGWGGACSGTGACSVAMTQARTVTATFTINTYALNVSVTGMGTVASTPAGISCGSDCDETYDHGTSVMLTATPQTGWSFTSWGGACSGNGACSVSMTQARNVTATFTINTYALNVTVAGMGTVTSNPAGISCGGDCTETYPHGTNVMLTAMPQTGWSFMGWGGACSGNGACSVPMTQLRNVSATFTINSYVLTLNKTGSTGTGTVTSTPAGISCGTACASDTGTFNHGQAVMLTATPATGSTFMGWSGGGCSGNGGCTVTMTAATTVTAVFAINTYALSVMKNGTGAGTVTSNPAGISCGATCSALFTHGTMVTLTAMQSTGSTFSGWSYPSCTGTGPCTVPMTAATTVTATFTLNTYTLTVNKSGTGTGTVTSSPAGINCGTLCASDSATFNHGQSVTLTATPGGTTAATASRFAGWTGGGCSGTGTCVVSMTQARTVTARFDIAPNVMFVTSTQYTGNLGGIGGASTLCQNRAEAAGLVGAGPNQNERFVAWLSSSSIPAAQRIGSATGWVRPDGRPVFQTLPDIEASKIIYPPRISELGTDVGPAPRAWSSTGVTGEYVAPQCTGGAAAVIPWGGTTGSGLYGSASATSALFTQFTSQACTSTARLYCMGVDRAGLIPQPTPATNFRLAFTSATSFNAASGLDGADAICRDEALQVGLPGSYRALLAGNGTTAISRFNTNGPTWVRTTDRVPIVPTAATLATPSLPLIDVAPNANADGTRVNVAVWTGARDPATPGTAATTCNNWASGGETGVGGYAAETTVALWFNAATNLACGQFTTLKVICLQE